MTHGIYVEILIRAPMDALWSHTQTPALHERWDLRFSRIQYLPKSHDDEPQRFHYSTRLGFGVEVSGEGESVGQRDSPDGSRSSALKFWSPRFQLSDALQPIADVREWYDDATQCFRIVVDVHNRVWGPLFGYRGNFTVEWRTVSDVPGHILPVREEGRE